MNLSETIIKIHSIAAQNVGELEADEFVSSMMILVLNDLKKTGELNPENLALVFEKKLQMVQSSEIDYEQMRPRLTLISNE